MVFFSAHSRARDFLFLILTQTVKPAVASAAPRIPGARSAAIFSYSEHSRSRSLRPRSKVARQRHKKESAISRVLSWATIPLGCASPRSSSDLPGSPHAGHMLRPKAPLASLFGLAPGGVCRAARRCRRRGALLPHHFTLTGATCAALRRYLSVALSVDSRPPGVTWHRALWSPDFPPPPPACAGESSGCQADS